MQLPSRDRLIHWSHAGFSRLHLSLPVLHGVQLSCDLARFCLRWLCALLLFVVAVAGAAACCSWACASILSVIDSVIVLRSLG
jgi:hypothetical protein